MVIRMSVAMMMASVDRETLCELAAEAHLPKPMAHRLNDLQIACRHRLTDGR